MMADAVWVLVGPIAVLTTWAQLRKYDTTVRGLRVQKGGSVRPWLAWFQGGFLVLSGGFGLAGHNHLLAVPYILLGLAFVLAIIPAFFWSRRGSRTRAVE